MTMSYQEALMAIKNNTHDEINLSPSGITDAQAKELAEALKENTSLTSLDLQLNKMSPAGVKDIAEALKANTSLRSLNLEGNKIGDDGVKELAEALKKNTILTTLGLIGNDISDAGVKNLAEALKANTSLTSLDLKWNKIDNAQATVFLQMLKINANITNLELKHWSDTKSSISESVLTQINEQLDINKQQIPLKAKNNFDLFQTIQIKQKNSHFLGPEIKKIVFSYARKNFPAKPVQELGNDADAGAQPGQSFCFIL